MMKTHSTLLTICGSFLFLVTNAQVPNDMVVYLSFNGHANDISHSNLNGIVNGAQLTTGADGMPNGAYQFDGVDDYIEFPHSTVYNFEANDPFSVSVCLKQAVLQNQDAFDVNTVLGKWKNSDGSLPSSGTGGYPFVFRVFNQTATNWDPGIVAMHRYDGSANSGGCVNATPLPHESFSVVKNSPYQDQLLSSAVPAPLPLSVF